MRYLLVILAVAVLGLVEAEKEDRRYDILHQTLSDYNNGMSQAVEQNVLYPRWRPTLMASTCLSRYYGVKGIKNVLVDFSTDVIIFEYLRSPCVSKMKTDGPICGTTNEKEYRVLATFENDWLCVDYESLRYGKNRPIKDEVLKRN